MNDASLFNNLTFCSAADLQGGFLVPEGLLEGLDVLLLVVYLLHGLAQVGLQLAVRVSSLLH